MSTQSIESKTRESIMKIKADIPTINIIGHAWRQTENNIIIYIKLERAGDVKQMQTCILERSLDITFLNHNGANHNFQINQLYGLIVADKVQFKPKGDKIIVTLEKAVAGEEWLDLKTKSTQTIYNQLSRNPEKASEVVFLSPFLSPGNSPK